MDSVGEPDPWEESLRIVFFGFLSFLVFGEFLCKKTKKTKKKTILRDSVGEPHPWEEFLRIGFFGFFGFFGCGEILVQENEKIQKKPEQPKKPILRDSVGEPDPWEESLRIGFFGVFCLFWFLGNSCARKPKKPKKNNPEGLWFLVSFDFLVLGKFLCKKTKKSKTAKTTKKTKKTILRDSVGEPDPWGRVSQDCFFLVFLRIFVYY